MPLNTERADYEVKTNGGEAVIVEEGEKEANAKEDHHVDIIEQRVEGVPLLLRPRIILEFYIERVENEDDDLKNEDDGNMEVFPP